MDDLYLSQLITKAKSGNDIAFEKILEFAEPEIKKIVNKFYIVGSDDQDVKQECRIGVWKAVKDFDENGGMTFKNFAVLCCKRHLITAMSHANTQKFRIQNESISLSAPVSQHEEEGMLTYADYIPDPNSDLLNNYIIKEEFDTNLDMMSDKLTKLEMSIFGQYAYNSSYKDIAKALGVKPKTVDNALMRIRKKSQETYQTYISTHLGINIGFGSTCVMLSHTIEYDISIGLCSNLI